MLGQYKDTARGHLEHLQYEDFNKDNLKCEDNIEYDNDLKNEDYEIMREDNQNMNTISHIKVI